MFLASILTKSNNGPKWKDNFKILSYNYDNQLEIAYDYYKDYGSAIPDLKIFDNSTVIKNPNIIKLNGFASYGYSDNNGEENKKFDQFSILKPIADLSAFFNEPSEINNTQIHFAWEEDDYSKNALKASVEIIKETESLVIIGYSFPEFNRNNDESILKELNPKCKVFIQTTDATFNNISSRFNQRSLNKLKNNIEKILFTDQFFIP